MATQLQNFAVTGLKAEGRMEIDYTDLPVTLGDGTVVTLREPHYSVADLGFGPMAKDVMLSPRVAPPMIGLGLVEQIPAEDILRNADPDDADGDGISGKANWVKATETGQIALGRFGWKAGAPTIRTQSAGAFAGDIGISTPINNAPFGDCMPNENGLLRLPDRRTGAPGRVRSAGSDPRSGDVLFAEPRRAATSRRGQA